MTMKVVTPAIVSRASVVPFAANLKRRSSIPLSERAAVSDIAVSLALVDPCEGDNERRAGRIQRCERRNPRSERDSSRSGATLQGSWRGSGSALADSDLACATESDRADAEAALERELAEELPRSLAQVARVRPAHVLA